MTIETEDYDIPAIRDLLTAAFTDCRDLRRFCQSHRDFQPVLQLVNERASLQEHVDELIGYCETQLLFGELLAGVKQANSRQYARFAPLLGDSASGQSEDPLAQSPSTGPQQAVAGRAFSPDESREVGSTQYLLFDESHRQKGWRYIPPIVELGYSAARQALTRHGSVRSNRAGPLSKATLQECAVLILPMPYNTSNTYDPAADSAEYEVLEQWVYQGGRLLMCGFYFMEAHHYTTFSSLAKLLRIEYGRDLIMRQGRTSRDDAIGQTCDIRRDLCAFVEPSSSDPTHPIMSGIRKVAIQSSCTVHWLGQEADCALEVRTDRNVSVMAPKEGVHHPTIPEKFDLVSKYAVEDAKPVPFLVAAPFGRGRVVATGSWRMFVDAYMDDESVDNAKLFSNCVCWLLGVSTEASQG